MGQGRSIYPQEGLNRFDDVLEQIRSTRCFSMAAFDIALEQSEEFKTLDEVNAALQKCDETKLFGGPIIIGGEDHVKVSRQRIRQFNRKHCKCLFSEMNQYKKYRRCLPVEKRIKEEYFSCPLLLTGTNS